MDKGSKVAQLCMASLLHPVLLARLLLGTEVLGGRGGLGASACCGKHDPSVLVRESFW